MLSFVKKLVRYQHFVTSPNLKRILRVVYSSLLNLADSITDTLTGRINTKPGEFGNQSLYHSVSMYSKFDRKEIKQAMEFTFSRESVQEQLDSRIILGDQNKRFVVNALGRKFLGLSEPGKPISTIMAIGTTGTGKTETAKSIAEIGYGSSERLIIVNMNEFSQSHHVNKLLGSAPGYVGYGEGSFLTRELEKHNPCVILFDEIEKAHPEVLNTLLNILDEGMLTDGTGKRYDITKCIVILTSNMGIELLGKKPLGFSEKDKTYEASDLKEHIIEMGMRPEFLNRIDGFLVYEKLSDEMRRKIAVMNLDKLTQGILSEREVTFKDSEKIVEYIVENSNPNEGGRSINRVIKNVIIPSIIDLMIEKEETEQIEFLPENIKEEYEI